MTAAYHPAFKAGFDAAVRRYGEIAPSLAERFKAEVKAGVKRVLSGVVNHAPGPHGYRCYRCKKFPYLVYYEAGGKSGGKRGQTLHFAIA